MKSKREILEQKIRRIIWEELNEATPPPRDITPDEFANLPSRPRRQKVNKFDRDSVLSANARVTDIVRNVLENSPKFKPDEYGINSLIGIIRRGTGYNFITKTMPLLTKKYGSFETYLQHLVKHLREE